MNTMPFRAAALALLFAAAPALAQTATAAQPGAEAESADEEDAVLATVNGTEIRESDLQSAYENLPPQFRQMPLPMLYEPLLNQLVDRRLIALAAEKEGLAEEPEVQRQIERARERALQEAYLERALQDASSEEALRERFEKEKAEAGEIEEVRARHILVESEEEAKQIVEQLEGGADFAQLAEEKSEDQGSASRGGDLGYFERGTMVPEFEEAAFALEKGAVSQPVQTQFGWHVIKLEDHRTRTPTFEEAKDELAAELAREKVQEIVTALREDATIERTDPQGQQQEQPGDAPAGEAPPAQQ